MMKKVILIAVVLCLAFGTTFAQDFRTYNFGILMTTNGLDNLVMGGWEGGVGAVIHLSNIALRPALNINSTTQKNGTEQSTFGFGLGCDVLKYLSTGRICPYVGGGIGFGSTKIKTENGVDTETSVSEFLVRGVAGIEIFLLKNFSLMFEYRLTYNSTDTEVDTNMAKAAQASAASYVDGKTTALSLAAYNMLTLNFYLGNLFK